MNRSFALLRAKAAHLALFASLSATFAAAQTAPARIVGEVNNYVRTTLPNTRLPLATAANDAGRVPANTQLEGVTIYLSKSAAQQSAIEALIVAQQNPDSSQYHQWLTPGQYASQFGAADADIAKIQTWLQGQGLTLGAVSRNRSAITVTGTVAQIEGAFGTEIHYFNVGGKKHFAPASDLSVPAALGVAISDVGNLADFRPQPHVKHNLPIKADFSSGQTLGHFMTPKDVATIYDVNAAYNSGWTGVGQTITVVGESAVYLSDITNFQTAAGTPVRAPNMMLVPGTGFSYLSQGDEYESDVDLEYAGAIAKGATIDFVYTGSSANYGVYDAIGYAVTNKIGNIISVSYGSCEAEFGLAWFNKYDPYLQQAALQGQSVVVSSGDDGSLGCYEYPAGTYPTGITVTSAQQGALSVSWPGSSAYVTSLGGTEFPLANVATTNTTYWMTGTGTDTLSSATQYIPEMAWNDASSTYGLAAGGGGISTFSLHPSWQTGVPGIPASAYRLVPDISLDSSLADAPYLLCSSDPSSNITGSCSYGFRDGSNLYLTSAGGTSFAAPIFAGMLAIINQSKASTGAGLINPTLYTLAANTATYASAFHDIGAGSNNGCTLGSTYQFSDNGTNYTGPSCTTATAGSYATTAGYDLATGLGSIDLNNLLTAWPGTTASAPKKFTIAASALTIVDGSTGTETFTITPANGYTGTVNLAIATTPYILGACYTVTSAAVTGTSAVTATATVYTLQSNCPAGALTLAKTGVTQAAVEAPATHGLPVGIAMAGLLAIGFMGRRSRRLRGIVAVAVLTLAASLGLTGCGSGAPAATISGNSGTTVTNTGTAPKGTYTMSVVGTDSTTGVSATTTFTMTVQ